MLYIFLILIKRWYKMPKKDGSGKGVGANKNTGGCSKGGPGHGKGSGRNNGGRK